MFMFVSLLEIERVSARRLLEQHPSRRASLDEPMASAGDQFRQ